MNGAKIFTNEIVDKAIEEALNLVKQNEMLEFIKKNIEKLKKGNASDTIIEEMGL